jgi:hypothetical protein
MHITQKWLIDQLTKNGTFQYFKSHKDFRFYMSLTIKDLTLYEIRQVVSKLTY